MDGTNKNEDDRDSDEKIDVDEDESYSIKQHWHNEKVLELKVSLVEVFTVQIQRNVHTSYRTNMKNLNFTFFDF